MAMKHTMPDQPDDTTAFCRACGKVSGTLARSASGEMVEVVLAKFGRGNAEMLLCRHSCFRRAKAARRRERDGRSVPA